MEEEILKDILKTYLKKCENEEISPEDIDVESYDNYGLSLLSIGNREYAIGTDSEADSAVEQSIEDSLYAFNPGWIVSHLDVDFPVEAIKAIQEKYEDANEPLKTIIRKMGDWDHFVKDSVLADGRGHFLSSYDGEENEIWYDGYYYYIYRIN